MGSGHRILLIEDDHQLGRALLQSLEPPAWEVIWARTLAEGDLHLRTRSHDALLLDLGLPDGSGLSILRQLRARGDGLPVLILTARDAVEDRVRGLDEGADDYLVKPFAIPELQSRIRALVRRSQGHASRHWVLGDLELDPEGGGVLLQGAPVELSPREGRILLHLARRAGRVVSRASLEEEAFDLGEEPESNALEVHIHHLRRKLGPARIRTVRGLGYLLESS